MSGRPAADELSAPAPNPGGTAAVSAEASVTSEPGAQRQRAVWQRLIFAQLILAGLVFVAMLLVLLASLAGIGVFAHRAL